MDAERFGARLLELLKEADLDLEQVAEETKISMRVLRALTAGDFQYLPEPVFTRNFVAQIAELAGYDSEKLVALFDKAWEHFRVTSGSHPAIVVVDNAPHRISPVIASMIIPFILLLLVIAAGVGLVLWRKLPQQVTVERPTPAPPTVPAFLGTMPTAYITPTPAPTELSILFKVLEGQDCWIRVRDASGFAFQELVTGPEERSYKLKVPAQLTLGNAAAAMLVVDGHQHGPFGAPGQVVHLELSKEGLKEIQ